MGRMLDSNVLLDILTADPQWLDWSRQQFRAASAGRNDRTLAQNPDDDLPGRCGVLER